MSCNHDIKNCTLDMGRGCAFCHGEGGEARACMREGCFKLHETDWLEGYPAAPAGENDIFEVRFKNTHRGYYRNTHALALRRGDVVVVESSPGHDVGIVSLGGDMLARQMRRTGFSPQNGEFRAIQRKAKPYDIERWQEAIGMEHETMIRSRQITRDMRLDMKIGDVEYQGDRIKAIFYYIADGRVDFRELIKVFASEFGIKVEMKQIGARQEAGRIGGLGSCGRELCCTSWIASFNSVTTGAARTQDISLNPQKLAGQCCKLKCCLSYELDAYIDAHKSMPRVGAPLQALDGDYYLISSDVLGGTMSFSTVKGAAVGNVVLSTDKVREILDMNRKGSKPDSITGIAPVKAAQDEEPAFVNMVGEESITRFDRSGGRRKRGRGGNGGGERGDRGASSGGEHQNGNREGGERGAGNRPNRRNNRQGGENRNGGNREGGENRGENRPANRPANRGGENNNAGRNDRGAGGEGRPNNGENRSRNAESRENGENRRQGNGEGRTNRGAGNGNRPNRRGEGRPPKPAKTE